MWNFGDHIRGKGEGRIRRDSGTGLDKGNSL